MLHRLFALMLFMVVASCGGSAPNVDHAEEELSGPPQPWAEMDQAARTVYMAQRVVPTMKPLFQAYDAERFADFSCATCHGANAGGTFAMPNPDILALSPTGSPEQHQMVRDYPEGVRFMFNQVLPTMKTLLGAQEYDAEAQTGFSCYACHTSAEATRSAP